MGYTFFSKYFSFIRTTLRYVVFFFAFLLLSLNCTPTEPKFFNEELQLHIEDISCTEAWVTLRPGNLKLPAEITIYRNSVAQNNILCYGDTLLFIDSLLPNQTYTIQAIQKQHEGNQQPVTSNKIAITTMDTTSSNFTWETYAFGDFSNNYLNDVVIIDENNIWVVGKIKIADTSSIGYTTYNAMNWNGNEWILHRVMFKTICGQQSSQNAYEASSIITFSENDIWIAQKGDQISKIENRIQTQAICMPWIFSINKIWGTRNDDLYVVGNNGNIAHYNGSKWNRIESGTITNINDIWGVVNPITQEQTIYCAVSFVFQAGDRKILTIKNNKVDSLSWTVGRRLHSVWSKNGLFVYTAGGLIHENKRGYWNEITGIPPYYSRSIRGTEYNNIFVCGDYGLFSHYNGLEWKTFNELSIQGIYSSVAVKNNIVVTVGFEGDKAIIVKGIRN